MGNKSNGLLSKTPNANSNGVTPQEILQNLSGDKTAPTATQKISETISEINKKVRGTKQ